jgi:hypothetical protein
LRLTTAFEIHWDSALLCERATDEKNRQFSLVSDRADLRWHGFSQFETLPDCLPLTPNYQTTQAMPPWSRTPEGWCTRYGPVDELVRDKDDKLVVLNGGDELVLSFQADRLPPKPPELERSFFLYVVGWDKDADFHVGQGWRVEPFPFWGIDDQAYGKEPTSRRSGDWMRKYNTRWVGPIVLKAGSSR